MLSSAVPVTAEGAVKVRFVSDDDVIEHIYNLSDASKKKKNVKGAAPEPSLAENLPPVAGVEQDETPVPIGLHANSDALTGREVFNLTCTPKAKHVVLAASMAPSREQRKSSSSTPRQPAATKSPYTLRKKIKQKLSKMKEENDTSSGESDSEKSSEDDVDEESGDADLGKYSSYFISSSWSKTSNHTLTKLGRPVMAPDEINSILGAVNDPHAKHRERLLMHYRTCFSHWLALLREGFSLLLYGPGSKMNLLQKFKEDKLADFACITVNGFNPALSSTEVLSSIVQCIPSSESTLSSLGQTQMDHIIEYFSKEDAEDIFIVINNIDGLNLRNAKAQEMLSTLSAARHIHIVASVDHISAALHNLKLYLKNKRRTFREERRKLYIPLAASWQMTSSSENGSITKQCSSLLPAMEMGEGEDAVMIMESPLKMHFKNLHRRPALRLRCLLLSHALCLHRSQRMQAPRKRETTKTLL